MAGDTEMSLLVYSLSVIRLTPSAITLLPLSSRCEVLLASFWKLPKKYSLIPRLKFLELKAELFFLRVA